MDTRTFWLVLVASGLACTITSAGIYVISHYEQWGKRYAAYFTSFAAGMLLAAALSTPLGSLLSYPFVDQVGRSMLGLFLALSAGALVYVGATHLLPQVEQKRKRFSVVTLAVGALVGVLIIQFKG
jgi:zinc transporter ZupT